MVQAPQFTMLRDAIDEATVKLWNRIAEWGGTEAEKLRAVILATDIPQDFNVSYGDIVRVTINNYHENIEVVGYHDGYFIGITQDNVEPTTGIPMAYIAGVIEFGSATTDVPARPIFVPFKQVLRTDSKRFSKDLAKGMVSDIRKEMGMK